MSEQQHRTTPQRPEETVMRRLLFAALVSLSTGLVAGPAHACVPTQAHVGTVGCQPQTGAVAGTDYVMVWLPGSFPNSSQLINITNLFAGRPFSTPVITGGTINNAIIGGTIPNNGTFTNLIAGASLSGAGVNALFASPPALGGTAPNAGAFTTLSVNGSAWVPTCPAANCAGSFAAPNVVAKAVMNGVTAQGAQAEWLSSFGLYNNTGIGFGGSNRGQKVTLYLGQVQGQNAGPGWTLNTDIVRCGASVTGWDGTVGSSSPCSSGQHVDTASATIGYELDFTNWDKEGTIGSGPFTVGIWINTLSTYTSTAGIYMAPTAPQSVPSWEDGILFQPLSVKENTIFDNSGAQNGYSLAGTHQFSGIWDNSAGREGIQISGAKSGQGIWLVGTAPLGINISGTYTTSDISVSTSSTTSYSNSGTHSAGTFYDNSASPVVFAVFGTHAGETFNDASTTPAAINLSGTYALAAINTGGATTATALALKDGQDICFSGVDGCFQHTGGKLYYKLSGAFLFSVADTTGNVIFKGTVTPSGSP
jgi:hypothetical protein